MLEKLNLEIFGGGFDNHLFGAELTFSKVAVTWYVSSSVGMPVSKHELLFTKILFSVTFVILKSNGPDVLHG